MNCRYCVGHIETVLLNYGVCVECLRGYIIEEEKTDRLIEATEYYKKEAQERNARYWDGDPSLKEASDTYVPKGYVQDG